VIRGLSYQNLVFAHNCPGGGHGELVLSGTYSQPLPKTPAQSPPERQQVYASIPSKVQAEAKLPVWVTMPDYDISSVQAYFQSEADPQERVALTVTLNHSVASNGRYLVVYDPNGKRVALMVRSWWQTTLAHLHNRT